MRVLRALWRLARGGVHVLRGLWTVLTRFGRLSPTAREQAVQVWALQLLALWGVHLQVRGQPVREGGALLVSNHISWLDILVIHAARYCRFVSKADVQGWPLIGTLATGAGTLYIRRERRQDAMRVVHAMAKALSEGDVLAIFPEGTTSDGRQLLPFHANLLQAALHADVPVQPLALRFENAHTAEPSFAPCYVGEDTLVASIWRTLSAPHPITAVVHFGAPERAQGRDRREWAQALHARVQALRG